MRKSGVKRFEVQEPRTDPGWLPDEVWVYERVPSPEAVKALAAAN